MINARLDDPACRALAMHFYPTASPAHANALQAVYPIGTQTTYVRKGSPRRVVCTVVGHREGQVRVRGRSGAEYYVRAAQLALPV